ncbi:MAG: hypothetical protein PHE68_02575 [Candidatus Peribacteraceae bacterium]|nr:hypothetical protein [Candidatus Peribacteraceae bacterium]
MPLTPHDVRQFQALWREHYQEELTEEQAREYGESLLRYVRLVLDTDDDPRERAPP